MKQLIFSLLSLFLVSTAFENNELLQHQLNEQ